MKINPDAIRSVLLCIEDSQKIDYNSVSTIIEPMYFTTIIETLSKKFDKQDILYSLIQLAQAEYISAFIKRKDEKEIIVASSVVYDITWDGHEFVNTIRDTKMWSNIKRNAEIVGDCSVAGLKKIAKFLTNIIINNPDIISNATKFYFSN